MVLVVVELVIIEMFPFVHGLSLWFCDPQVTGLNPVGVGYGYERFFYDFILPFTSSSKMGSDRILRLLPQQLLKIDILTKPFDDRITLCHNSSRLVDGRPEA